LEKYASESSQDSAFLKRHQSSNREYRLRKAEEKRQEGRRAIFFSPSKIVENDFKQEERNCKKKGVFNN
jgi:hypothetical protein